MAAERAFSGSIPENYNHYLVPMIFEDYAQELASRVPAGAAVLSSKPPAEPASRPDTS